MYQYEIKITPEVPPSLNRKIFQQLEVQFVNSIVGQQGMTVFDGRQYLYSPIIFVALQNKWSENHANDNTEDVERECIQLDVCISDENENLAPGKPINKDKPKVNPRTFNIKISLIAKINMENLIQFVNGKKPHVLTGENNALCEIPGFPYINVPLVSSPIEALQALDVLLRHRPSLLLTTGSFFI